MTGFAVSRVISLRKRKNRMICRLPTMLLLAALPLIFCSAAADAREAFTFHEIEGWSIKGNTGTYDAEKLYQYINGAADSYIAYGFQKLLVADYTKGGDVTVTAEVYRHESSRMAFGIYSQERSPDEDFIEIGTEGYAGDTMLAFFKGRYYVKLLTFGVNAGGKEVRALARALADNIESGEGPPRALSVFPEQGKVDHSEKFIPDGFLGYPFLVYGYTADYRLDGEAFEMFIIEAATELEAERAVSLFLRENGILPESLDEGYYSVEDRYHGHVDILWKDELIIGVQGADDTERAIRIISKAEKRIPR